MERAAGLLRTEGPPDLNFQMACDDPFLMFSSNNTSVFDNLFSAFLSGLQGNIIKITFLMPLPPFSHLVKRRYLYQLLSKNSFTCLYFAVFPPPLIQADIESSISVWKSDYMPMQTKRMQI